MSRDSLSTLAHVSTVSKDITTSVRPMTHRFGLVVVTEPSRHRGLGAVATLEQTLSVETELVALDVLHHEARLVLAIGTQ